MSSPSLSRLPRTKALLIVGILGAATVSGCTSESQDVQDPIEGPVTEEIDANLEPVDQGVEGGLDLDSGNVPGSNRDDKVDFAENSDGLEYDE